MIKHLESHDARMLIEQVTGKWLHKDTLLKWAERGQYGISANKVGGRNVYIIDPKKLPNKNTKTAA